MPFPITSLVPFCTRSACFITVNLLSTRPTWSAPGGGDTAPLNAFLEGSNHEAPGHGALKEPDKRDSFTEVLDDAEIDDILSFSATVPDDLPGVLPGVQQELMHPLFAQHVALPQDAETLQQQPAMSSEPGIQTSAIDTPLPMHGAQGMTPGVVLPGTVMLVITGYPCDSMFASHCTCIVSVLGIEFEVCYLSCG